MRDSFAGIGIAILLLIVIMALSDANKKLDAIHTALTAECDGEEGE
jgi:hypothetical protein